MFEEVQRQDAMRPGAELLTLFINLSKIVDKFINGVLALNSSNIFSGDAGLRVGLLRVALGDGLGDGGVG